jgi:hypothetical protein
MGRLYFAGGLVAVEWLLKPTPLPEIVEKFVNGGWSGPFAILLPRMAEYDANGVGNLSYVVIAVVEELPQPVI